MEHTKLSKAGLIALFSLGLILAACTGDETSSISLPSSTTSDSTSSSTTSSTTEQYDIITVAEAIKIAETAPEDGTEEKYYIGGEVSNLTNTQFGNFDLVDSTGSFFVYGCRLKKREAKSKTLRFKSLGRSRRLATLTA